MNREYILKWCKKAESDLKAVKQLLEYEDPPTDVVCFHCQQAVEKYLKAFLTFHNIEVKKTHDIEFLLDLCIEQNSDFSNLLNKEEASKLASFAVDIRYPDEFYYLSINEGRESFKIALKVKKFVLNKLNIEESEIKRE